MGLDVVLFGLCGLAYAMVAVTIAARRPNSANLILAACCCVTSAWAFWHAALPAPTLSGAQGLFDVSRMLGWYTYIYYLALRSGIVASRQRRAFGAVPLAVAFIALIAAVLPLPNSDGLSLISIPIATRLTLCVCELLLIENLYLNLPELERWHVAIPCVLLGGLACFDILVAADAVLFHHPSPPLEVARASAMTIVAPLLLIAASRGQRWRGQVRLSRTAAFHSATLVLAGSVLLALALAGEVLRRLNTDWGWLAEISLVFAGCIGLMLFVSSRSARSLLQRVVTYHFLTGRYDYRVEWLKCIGTVSGTDTKERLALHTRAIRAVADVVDSPSGTLFVREDSTGAFTWAGSWNTPSGAILPADDPVVAETRGGERVVDLRSLAASHPSLAALATLGKLWLAVPLMHATGMVGLVIVGPPRVPLELDQEIFDLLRIVGREVATHLVEQRATEVMLQTRHLHDYGKRFAFVAHDIKNVASQLSLLLRNAEHHISNPEFQQDMLATVEASVQKIGNLLKRLERPAPDVTPSAVTPVPRLEALVATYARVRKATITLEHDGSTGKVAMAPDPFDTAVTHLLNNAVEAANGETVHVKVRHEASQLVIDIVDHGPGMSADFIRDHLFTPFRTEKPGGSGIGAFQARELVREAGGELLVFSEAGRGTTVRLVFARADQPVRTPTVVGV